MPPLSPRLLILVLGIAAISSRGLADPAPAAPAAAPAATTAVHLPTRMTAPEYRMGNPQAKVTVVEYASDTCSHCAKFGIEVFPDFKKKYIDTGKVLYVFREFPTDPVQLSAAGFVVARCAGQDKYFDVVSTLFNSQRVGSGKDFLMAGARVGGLDEAQVKACLNEPASLDELNARVKHAVDVDKINGTPTFIINGKRLEDGEKSLKDLDAVIAPLLTSTRTKAVQKAHKA